MIRLLHTSRDPEPCRKACSEYSLGLMPVHAGNLSDDLRFLSRLPEYATLLYIMTDGKAKYTGHYYTRPVPSFQSGVEVNLGMNRLLVSYDIYTAVEKSASGRGPQCVTIRREDWTVHGCAVGGHNAVCGCKRGERNCQLGCSTCFVHV